MHELDILEIQEQERQWLQEQEAELQQERSQTRKDPMNVNVSYLTAKGRHRSFSCALAVDSASEAYQRLRDRIPGSARRVSVMVFLPEGDFDEFEPAS